MQWMALFKFIDEHFPEPSQNSVVFIIGLPLYHHVQESVSVSLKIEHRAEQRVRTVLDAYISLAI